MTSVTEYTSTHEPYTATSRLPAVHTPPPHDAATNRRIAHRKRGMNSSDPPLAGAAVTHGRGGGPGRPRDPPV
jgi:hypothetical protein